jgi:hypothetical protein
MLTKIVLKILGVTQIVVARKKYWESLAAIRQTKGGTYFGIHAEYSHYSDIARVPSTLPP